MQWFFKFIYFKILGWKVVGNTNISKDTHKKAVIIAVPHTSWHDFYIGMLLRSVLKVKVHFLAKKELFVFPFGWFFRALGGSPLNRYSKSGAVKEVENMFVKKDEYRIALAPEGTRKKVKKWRTGFYYIAKEAKIPIIMFTFDFKNKQNKISEPFFTTDDIEADFKFMHQFYEGVEGRISRFS